MRLKEQNRRDSMSVYGAVMDELASATGGTYFHNSNDLEGGFQRVTKAPECVYLLEFSPEDAQRDGSFHRLSVNVSRRAPRSVRVKDISPRSPPRRRSRFTQA